MIVPTNTHLQHEPQAVGVTARPALSTWCATLMALTTIVTLPHVVASLVDPPNGSFETCNGCTSDAGHLPDGWTGYFWSGGDGAGWSTSDSRTGVGAMRIVDVADFATGAYSPTFPVSGGSQYTAGFYSRGPSTAASQAYVYFYDEAGAQVGFGWNGATPNPTTWTWSGVTLTAPSTATRACISVYANTASYGTSYIDDVEMRPGGGGPATLAGSSTGYCSVIAPSEPQNLQVTMAPGSATITWDAPASPGDSAIYNYRVYRGTPTGSAMFLADAGKSTTYTDSTCLVPLGCSYWVTAVNAAGEGPASDEASGGIPEVPSCEPTTMLWPLRPILPPVGPLC